MSLNIRAEKLVDKHRELDRRIEKEEAHPGSDDIDIHELKKEKLRIKDNLEKLRTGTDVDA